MKKPSNKRKAGKLTFALTSVLLLSLLLSSGVTLAQDEGVPETPTSNPVVALQDEPSPDPELTPEPFEELPVAPIPGDEEPLLLVVNATIPTPLNPGGLTYLTKPTYQWRAVTNASKYQIQVFRGTSKVLDAVRASTVCSGTTCSTTPARNLAFNTTYKWRARAYVSGAWQAYTGYKNFTIAASIPKTVSPYGTTTLVMPTYKWTRTANTTKYQVQVYRGASKVLDIVRTSTACAGSTCQTIPAKILTAAGHKWRVRAYVSGAWKPWCAYRSFTVASGIPAPISPAGTIFQTKPTYKWTRTASAAKYQVQVYRGTVKVLDIVRTSTACAGNTCQTTPSRVLAYAGHKWRVRAHVNGAWKTWSAYRSFTVSNPVPAPLTPDGTIYETKPIYGWSAVAGASSYQYEVYEGAIKVVDREVSDTSETPDIALNFAAHQWHVRAYTGGIWGAWSAFKDFTVANPVSMLQTPVGTIYSQRPTYEWSAVSGATNYQYEVYEGATKVVDREVNGTSETPDIDLIYADHQWRVRAYAQSEWKDWSDYQSFTVVNPVPAAQSPEGFIYIQQPTYSWSAVSGATNYQYQVYEGATKVVDREVNGTSETPDIVLNFADHQWRVRAYAQSEWKDWSDYQSFTMANPVPTTQTPDGTIYSQRPTYEWSAVSGATNYQYQVYEGTAKVIDREVSGTSETPDIDLNFTDHQWRVRAYAGDAWRAWSEYENFSVEHATTRVSVDSSGTQGNHNSEYPAISADGRYVAFHSNASNLVVGDTNEVEDIFVHDKQTGVTTRVSVDSSGNEGYGASFSPSISANGRYVAFYSGVTSLVAGDTNGMYDIFVHDTQTGSTTRVSLDSLGTQGNGNSTSPSISADGRFIAFHSGASNLVAEDNNAKVDVFVHDRQTGATTRVSLDSIGNEGNDASYTASISTDGLFVTFRSQASNLVAGDTNGVDDVFVHDRSTGTTTRVSLDSLGTQSDRASFYPSISADGLYVTFYSSASNLVAGDTNGVDDVFVHDTQTGSTTRVSLHSDGTQGNGNSGHPFISPDGRYVTYHSSASNLVEGDTNGVDDVFVHDTQTGATTRVSLHSDGTQGNGNSDHPFISPDGRYVTYHSSASNLVEGDTNGYTDIFVHKRW